MNSIETYAMRWSIKLPPLLLIVLTIALLGVCLVQGQPVAKAVFLGLLLIPLVLLLIETWRRRIEVSETGVTAIRALRPKQLAFTEITSLESVQVRSRVLLTLSAGDDDFLIISNSYADFDRFLKRLVATLPEQVVTEEARLLAQAPPQRLVAALPAWFAVAALVYILVAQFVR